MEIAALSTLVLIFIVIIVAAMIYEAEQKRKWDEALTKPEGIMIRAKISEFLRGYRRDPESKSEIFIWVDSDKKFVHVSDLVRDIPFNQCCALGEREFKKQFEPLESVAKGS